MSYAEARVDLTSVSVACLTGLNGAGKSAMLDAITWALWEAARASSDELVRLGQSEMWVDLCFSLEDQVYRVRRARQKTYGRGGQQTSTRGNLDLQVWNGGEAAWQADHDSGKNGKSNGNGNAKKNEDDAADSEDDDSQSGHWTSLTAASMRETQKRLRELLRMDYETFISSVYLRQGRADEFTTRSPNERKQVFADILGLDYFDQLQEICREEARECKGRIQILEANLSARSDFEQGFKDSCADIELISTQLNQVANELSECVAKEANLEAEIAKLNYLQIRAETARARSLELKADLESLGRRADELQIQEKKLMTLVRQADFVSEQFRQFELCKALSESLDLTAAKHSELSSRRLELRSRIAMFQGRMEVELEHLKITLESKLTRRRALEKSCNEPDKLTQAFEQYRRLLEAELEMSRKRESFTALTARADELQSMISESRVRLDAQIQQKESLLVDLDELLSGRDRIELDQQALKDELAVIDQVEAEFELVEEKGIKVKSQIEYLQQQILQLKKYIRENEEKVHELCETPDLSSCPLCRAPIVDSKAVLDRYNQDSQNARCDIDNIENQIESLLQDRDHLRKHYIDLRKKLEERKNLDMKIGEFNERKSAIERAEATRDELRRELEIAKQRLAEHSFAPVEKESLVRVRAELAKLDFDPIVFSSFQAQMRSQRHIEMRHQQLQKDLKELEDLNLEIPSLEGRIDRMEGNLREGNFGGDERAEISNLDKAIAELAYDKIAHQDVKRKLAELLPFAEKARDIERAQLEVPEMQRASAEIKNMISARKQELERLEEESQEWSRRLDELPAIKDELEAQSFVRQELELRQKDLEKRRMLLETRLQQLQEDKTELDSKKQLLCDNIREMSEHNQLAEAFGKKGIQAIIIENAIPEIEAEANRILSRLTDNQMHLALLTQQRTKQGNAIETLEIIIADDLGTRAYELYSGGEAFKVNFALRVAMSRLLARRAGAKLETLIIDEGFGSQDEYSRGKLIQAISSIKSDFARIIVVTHIAEVKDMFPVQISVNKEEGVSKVKILA